MTDATTRAEDQAKAQYESICEMVAALECDYERLQELKEERNDFSLDRMEDVDCNRACAEHILNEDRYENQNPRPERRPA